MKKIILATLVLFSAQIISAQVTTRSKQTTQVRTNNVRVIPASKAVMVRKNVANMKLQAIQLSDSLTATKKEIDSLVDSMKNDLDSLSEMGEMEALRLQMAMGRLSKMMSTLSNLLKKMSDTAQSITQNIK